MIEFVPNTLYDISTELEIMNSNQDYNEISCGKSIVTEKEILSEHKESEEIHSKRYFIRTENKLVGIVDFCPSSPKDKRPWIGLFVLHSDYHGTGLAHQAYLKFEEKLKNEGYQHTRLGILEENKQGFSFWKKYGYQPYKITLQENKTIHCFEKDI